MGQPATPAEADFGLTYTTKTEEVIGRPIDDPEIQKLIGPNFITYNHWVKDIAEMHTKFGFNTVIRTFDRDKLRTFLQFRVDFLQEELNELKDALALGGETAADDIVDALIDLCVVAIGTLNAFDVNEYEAWNRVHGKNMQKEPGIKANRPNPLGLPDLIKPIGWTSPTHADNVGLLSRVFDEDSPRD